MVREAKTLRSLDELNLSGRSRSCLRCNDLQEVVLKGRRLFHFFEMSEIEPKLKWQKELLRSLDANGFIRHDINPKSFGVSRLCCAIFPERENRFGPVDYSVLDNEGYEAYKGFSDAQISSFIEWVDKNTTPRRAEVAKLHFGLVDGKIWRLEDIGLKNGYMRERARQLMTTAIRQLRGKADINAFPSLP